MKRDLPVYENLTVTIRAINRLLPCCPAWIRCDPVGEIGPQYSSEHESKLCYV